MKFIPADIPGVWIIEPKVHQDDRGFFYESFRESVFAEHGITDRFVQDNHTRSSRGAVRGLHYQVPPMAQAKLIRVARGKIFDVVVDIREGSGTFGRHFTVTLDDQARRMLYVPVGFAHGYLVLEDNTEVLYKVSNFYSPAHDRGILWNDPALKIEWPKVSGGYILSEKDRKQPPLQQAVLM